MFIGFMFSNSVRFLTMSILTVLSHPQVSGRTVSSKTDQNRTQKSRPYKKVEKNRSLSPPIERDVDDLDILHASLKGQNTEEDLYSTDDDRNVEDIAQFHRTVQNLFEEEENLLNLHMSVIQVIVQKLKNFIHH